MKKKLLFFDPTSGVSVDLIRMDGGVSFPEHYITVSQITYVLAGALRRDDGSVDEAGSFRFVPAGEVQHAIQAGPETTLLRYCWGPPVYVLSDGSTFVTSADGHVVAAGRVSFVGRARPRNLTTPAS
jgi:hypothetical protein